MKSDKEIGEALDQQLRGAFPPDDVGYPQTPLTKRAAAIVEQAAGLLVMDGYPQIEGYNYRQTSHDGVTYNVRYPAEDGGIWVMGSGLTLNASDMALTQLVYTHWKSDFDGTLVYTKGE